MAIKMSEIIAPVYHDQFRNILTDKYNFYWNSGGRSSTKSSFISLCMIFGIMNDEARGELTHAIAFRKVAATLKDSVFNQLLWAIDKLGVNEFWQIRYSPLALTYKPNKARIYFRGLDHADKVKSIKVVKGHFKYIWFEELAEFDNMEEIEKTYLSLFRKNDSDLKAHFNVFMSYNPPQSPKNWVNIEVKNKNLTRYQLHTTYLDVPQAWHEQAFLAEAERTKEQNPAKYKHVFLGKVTGIDGLVYPMFTKARHVIDSLENGELISDVIVGVDGGAIIDATTAVPLASTTHGRIVCLPTFYYDPTAPGHQPIASVDQCQLIENYIDNLCVEYNFYPDAAMFVVDSAASDIYLELKRASKYYAKKVGKKDVLVDMRRVQSILSYEGLFAILNKGYIDPLTNNILAEEDMLIDELETKVINPKTSKPEDGNDHAIDAFKYATYELKKRGEI